MLISTRNLLIGLSIVVTLVALLMLLDSRMTWLAWVIIGCGLASVAALSIWPNAVPRLAREADDINDVPSQRRRELVRGTSLYLRELRYRYSIRIDPSESDDRRPFSAEVNTIKLGFVPVIITDNTNDRQGYGYAAFVHDGKRWRGPGLPCPAGQPEAVRHAARCVSPLAKEEETRF
jgi:hypothetical protein